MGAGPKRHRITIQHREVTGHNEYGEPIKEWVDEATLWASVEPLRGDEFFKGGTGSLPQTQAQVDARMRIRPRPGLNPADNRIVHKGIVYDMVAVIPDNQGRETQLMVRAQAVQQPDGSTVNG